MGSSDSDDDFLAPDAATIAGLLADDDRRCRGEHADGQQAMTVPSSRWWSHSPDHRLTS